MVYQPGKIRWFDADFLLDVLPLAVLLPLLLGITLSWTNTGSAFKQTLKQLRLQQELRQKLERVSGWDEFSSILSEFLNRHLPLNGLSLFVRNRVTDQDEKVVDRSDQGANGLHWLDSKLTFGNQVIGKLKVQLVSEELFLPRHYAFLESMLPEISYAVERHRLLLSVNEEIAALQKASSNQIARHLHDTLGDNLAYLRMRLDFLTEQNEYEGNAKLSAELERVRDVAEQAYEHVRGLLDELRVGISPDFSASLQECITLIESRAKFYVDYRSEGQPRQLPDHIQRQILYIVRELLRNVEKHARAKQVNLKLSWSETGLTIESANDGQGFDVVAAQELNGHHGLKIVQEIIEELNGRLQISSSEDSGSQINLWIPFSDTEVRP
jgi:signal transduction histidine kinase